jgi:glycine cleavage system aminomethyltransferase T
MVLTMSARQFSLVPHRSVIAVGGPDRIEFLQGLISNDTTKVAPGRAIWAALLTPQGRLNDMFVADGGNDTALLERGGAPGWPGSSASTSCARRRRWKIAAPRGVAVSSARRDSRRSRAPSPSSIRGLPTSACAC